MISERKFANSYTSFWNQLLPMADSFVRKVNLGIERYSLPLQSKLSSNRLERSVINELSFRIFKVNNEQKSKLTDNEVMRISNDVIKYINKFSHSEPNLKSINNDAIDEAIKISQILDSYFSLVEKKTLKFWPPFMGCALLHQCQGDILSGNKLVEVKAGERNFRINDIRQIITYLALNYNSKQYSIEKVALVNPRLGLEFETSVEILIRSCSGNEPVDVFSDIIYFISNDIGSF